MASELAARHQAVLEGFTKSSVTYDGVARTVYRLGKGPAVIVLPEVPGMTPLVTAFCRRVADAGFTVVVPSLFGTPGRPPSAVYSVATLARVCISREFHVLALREPSPVTAWLRALAGDAHLEHGGPGVGVVGMCLTGGFGLAMMADPTVIAPVLCQPSLPLPMGRSRRSAIGLSDADWRLVRHRVRAGCQVVGLRFTGDRVSPPERFELLRDRLGDDFTSFEIDSSPGNEEGIPTASHSVLTESFVDQPGHPTLLATNYVIGFLRQKLLGRPPPQPPTAATIQLYADARRQVLELLARAARRPSVGSHVFISYAHDDAAYVGDLVVALEARGIRAWYDAHIPTGATWETVLHQHVDTSRAVIVVMSTRSGASEWVAREILWAQERKKQIAPLLLNGPTLLSLGPIQYTDVTNGQLPPAEFFDDLASMMGESS